MNEKSILAPEYKLWLTEIKNKVRAAQLKAATVVNSALIEFYWDLGKIIAEKQEITSWGDKVVGRLSKDLQEEFPDLKGFSTTNLKYCRLFYKFYIPGIKEFGQQAVDQIDTRNKGEVFQQAVGQSVHQLVTQIPWGHNILIFSKSRTIDEARFYLSQTIENGWSRDVLALQIKSGLFKRIGKGVTNFTCTLTPPQSELATQTMKDPYVFDFLTMTKPYNEKDIENQLIAHITKFLLELGKGFAYIGRQYHLHVGETDYYIDLLFYHVKLRCYVVIELKNTRFQPEYAGKLNFYLSAVDSLLKTEHDNQTIGILLCRDKNNIETEFALRDINKPMGVSEFQLTEILPENLKSTLPTIEEIENELGKKEEPCLI